MLDNIADNNSGTYVAMHNGNQPVTIGKPGWASTYYFSGKKFRGKFLYDHPSRPNCNATVLEKKIVEVDEL